MNSMNHYRLGLFEKSNIVLFKCSGVHQPLPQFYEAIDIGLQQNASEQVAQSIFEYVDTSTDFRDILSHR